MKANENVNVNAKMQAATFSPELKAKENPVNIQNTLINSNWDELDQEYIDNLIYGIIAPEYYPYPLKDISLALVEINPGREAHLEHAYIFRVPAWYTKGNLQSFMDLLHEAAKKTWAEACIYQESITYLQTNCIPNSDPNLYNYLTYIITPGY